MKTIADEQALDYDSPKAWGDFNNKEEIVQVA